MGVFGTISIINIVIQTLLQMGNRTSDEITKRKEEFTLSMWILHYFIIIGIDWVADSSIAGILALLKKTGKKSLYRKLFKNVARRGFVAQ